jgi:hypothetical protein
MEGWLIRAETIISRLSAPLAILHPKNQNRRDRGLTHAPRRAPHPNTAAFARSRHLMPNLIREKSLATKVKIARRYSQERGMDRIF